jgi:hypothetical protein
MNAPTTLELRRQALAALNLQVRRTPSGYTARGSGAPCGPRDLIARDEAELRAVLARWLGVKA